MSSVTPEFLFVRPGDYVAIKKENCEDTKEKDANYLLSSLGFEEISKTYRMYKGIQPTCPMNQVYGLACLELGWFPLKRLFPLLFL